MILPSAFRAKMIAGSALVLLFGSGIVVGLAWDQTASASPPGEVREREESGRERGRRRLIVDNVGLSTVQKTAVDSLVVFHRRRMSDLDKEFQPRYRAVIADLREEIKHVLTDDQRAQYDVLLAERDARRAEGRRDDSRSDNSRR
jgi:hypothetical protein